MISREEIADRNGFVSFVTTLQPAGDTVACTSLVEEVGLHSLIGPERVTNVDSHPLSASAHPRHTSAFTSIGLRTCRRMKLCAPKTVISRLTGSQKGFNRAFQTNRALNFAC